MPYGFGILVFCLLGGSPPTVVQAEPAPKWNALFATTRGWIGGDGVASAVLGTDRVLVLFGDTLIGEVRDGGRHGAKMVNNSLALYTGRGKRARLDFAFGKERDGKPTASFTPSDGRGWFWPLSAIRAGKTLYFFMTQVEKSNGKGVFAFRL